MDIQITSCFGGDKPDIAHTNKHTKHAHTFVCIYVYMHVYMYVYKYMI